MARKPAESASNISYILESANIIQIADSLGIQLERKTSNPRRALCPFHQDQNPSLHFYHLNHGQDHFHCFACGAHGDSVDLVRRREGINFWPAIELIAELGGIKLPQRGRPAIDVRSGAELLVTRLRNTGLTEDLISFAERRGIAPELLSQTGAAAYDLSELRREAEKDRILQEQLVQAGVLRGQDRAAEQNPSFLAAGLRGFFHGSRIVFPINDVSGKPVGFAARSLGLDKPKYLYTYDFPRRDTLYGADRALKALTAPTARKQPAELFIVEGLMDQLRLQSLGKVAVALLGARITGGQIERFKQLTKAAEDAGRELTVRVFLDPDEAGRKGAYDTLLALMRLLDRTTVFDLDVIVPAGGDGKLDPDEYLKGQSSSHAETLLQTAAVHPLRFLLAVATRQPAMSYRVEDIGRIQFAASAREIAKSLPDVSWSRVLAPIGVGEADLEPFAELIRSYSLQSFSSVNLSSRLPGEMRGEEKRDNRASLITAITIGRSSTSRREYPLDDDAWERLAVAASPFFHIHAQRLAIGDTPLSPLLARELPKGNGRYRLKSGPTAPDALLQQYALVELLRDHPEAPGFASFVPAIRYSESASTSATLYRTGQGGEGEALSFAYQVNMAVVNGIEPPRREGIFRPYFECWRSFIDFLDQKIRNYRHEDLQILRLDITGFYENVRRDIVANALQIPLDSALSAFQKADGGPLAFAPLLHDGKGEDTVSRARLFTQFLLDHSFDLKHFHPHDGRLEAVKGLPQGPDLSAYLANISLFSLDEMMAKEIAYLDGVAAVADEPRARCSAAYARYVDDIIIVCPTMEIAAQLRRKVEAHLQIKGLSLNNKNAVPPAMTRTETREWLTDNRGGFGFSGPLAEMPVTEFMDPLADAGDIDRRTALGLLFDPELDDLRDPELILKRIGLALQAEEIRFGDRANAYRRIWQVAAQEVGPGLSAAVAAAFWSHLLALDPFLQSINDEEATDTALACLESLDRALRADPPRGAQVETVQRARIARSHLARAFLGDLVTPIMAQIFANRTEHSFLIRYDVRCHIAIIASLAAGISTATFEAAPFERLQEILAPQHRTALPLPIGLRLSLLRYDGAFDRWAPSLTAATLGQPQTIFESLETALVRLQRFDGTGSDLPPVSAPSDGVDRLDAFASSILRIWSPDGSSRDDEPVDPIEFDAAATLINVTYHHFSQIIPRRPRLLHIIAGQQQAVALPSPPGLATEGVLLWCMDGSLLVAAASEETPKPLGVEWERKPLPNLDHLYLFQARLDPGTHPLFDLGNHSELASSWPPERIASTYRAGLTSFARLLRSSTNVPVPTAFSFFHTGNASENQSPKVQLICWAAPRTSLDSHAFVRSGGALEARGVHSKDSDYWRFGWAIRDLCGRANGMIDAETELDRDSDTPLDRERHRREAILARVLPRLSGADRWGAGILKIGSVVPSRIDRTIRILEAFGRSSDASVHAAYLVAATAEGAFMSERLSSDGNPDIAGRPAMLALRAAWRASRCLPPAAAHWFEDQSEFLDAPYRRSSAAWFSIAQRLRFHAQTLEAEIDRPMHMLVLGIELLGLVSDLRALAFEVSATLAPDVYARLRTTPLDLSSISDHLGLEAILVEGPEAANEVSLDVQVRRLIEAFDSISRSQRGGARVRDSITPLGWAVLVSTLLQVTPPQSTKSERPALWPMSLVALTRARSALNALIPILAAPGASAPEDDNWPWELFKPLTDAQPANLAELLRELTRAASLEVETVDAWTNPRTGETENGRSVIRLADGSSQRLSEWQVDIAYITGERRTSTEYEEHGYRRRYRYSVTRLGDRVLGVHLVSHTLAQVAFATAATTLAKDTNAALGLSRSVLKGADVATAPEAELEEHSSYKNETLDERVSAATVVVEAEHADWSPVDIPGADRNTETYRNQSAGGEPGLTANDASGSVINASAPTPVTMREHVPRIRAFQDIQWTERGKRDAVQQRLALVQWDVVETYSSPGAEDGKGEGLLQHDGKPPEKDKLHAGGTFLSIAEGRRRAILQEVLRACDKFKVDGLVLPEYSVRPETVNWLARQLVQLNLPLTIWCGTFRVPDGSRILTPISPSKNAPPFQAPNLANITGYTPWESHSAMLTCLNATQTPAGTTVTSHVRRKRYPSAAAGELIRPPIKEPYRPLLVDKRDPFELGTFTVELVCSEMFPHASSANFIGILEENHRLALRYGLRDNDHRAFEELTNDIREFAKWTAYRGSITRPGLNRGRSLQRTVMILPAMTSRSADYHIFGQNQHLAAGLVTVFCNAVDPKVGCGGSAFIGLDGWKSAAPVPSPYGVIAPGIFRLNDDSSGHLGTSEAAMVIVDLDPIRTTDQRPRPHYQTRALELVAHLPLLFSTEADPSDRHRRAANRRPRFRLINGKQQSFLDICASIVDILDEPKSTWRDDLAIPNPDTASDLCTKKIVHDIVMALKGLEAFADDPKWLEARTASFAEKRWTYSPPGYLPALTDWLYIDDNWVMPTGSSIEASSLEVDSPLLDVPRACSGADKQSLTS